MMLRLSITAVVAAALSSPIHAFLPTRTPTTTLPVSSTASSSSSDTAKSSSQQQQPFFTVELVKGGEDDPRVVDIATFRNDMVDPQAMVERAQEKRDNLDTTKAAIDGLKVGLLQVGPAIGLATYFTAPETMSQDQAIRDALTYYGLFGGGLGVLLAGNGYIGKSVYVPDVAEATNRIVVDYSEGILRQQDFGFVAVLNDHQADNEDDDDDMKRMKRVYRFTNGVIATVDAQWRNSPNCPKGTKQIPKLPPHLHIKNMEVHYKQRGKGVGKALLELIIDHAKKNTDAEILTL
jgi:GNAT superfamily N-acetyltransferase